MQLAYIVSAYRNLSQVTRLVRRLANDDSCFFVHVDRKTDRREYETLVRDFSRIEQVDLLPRHVCHWGGFGHVRATLKGIAALRTRGTEYSHAILLTGQDYPIKPVGDIHSFFAGHLGSSFMGHHSLPSPLWSPRGGLGRIEYRHVRWHRLHLRLPGKRAFPTGVRPFGGGAYWCLTKESIDLVARFVADRPDVVRFFERVDIPDEIFFQTILMSSELANTVVNDNLRYVDWSRGRRPAVLGIADLESLRASPKLFARKFDVTEDSEILDAIDHDLLGVR